MPTHLLIHGVGTPRRELEPGEDALWIDPSQLADALDVAAACGATISVDDGNASDVDHVLPALVERGLTATFFVLAGRLDQPGSLSRAAVAELRSAGMRIGSHGMHHRSWRSMQEAIEHEELVVAREVISDLLGEAVAEAAFPFGAYDRRGLRALRDHGYRRAYTSDGWPAATASWVQPRYSIHRDIDVDALAATLSRHTLTPLERAKKLWKRLR